MSCRLRTRGGSGPARDRQSLAGYPGIFEAGLPEPCGAAPKLALILLGSGLGREPSWLSLVILKV